MLGRRSESSSLLSDYNLGPRDEESKATSGHLYRNGCNTTNNNNRHRETKPILNKYMEKHPSAFYKHKDGHGMSSAAFQTIVDEMVAQRETSAKLSRSISDGGVTGVAGVIGGPERATEEQKNLIAKHGRRALYGALPMVSAFGMQHRENSIRRLLSTASCNALQDILEPSEYEKTRLLSDVDVDEMIVTLPLVMSVFVAVILQFLLGFNTAILNAPAAVIFPGHGTVSWSMAVSALAIGGPFGAMAGGVLANQQGRKGAILINTWIYLIGGLLMTFSPNVYYLIPARIVIGFASGLASVVVPVYLGEISPPTLRGTLGSFTQFAMVVGLLMSGLLSIPLGTLTRWRYLFALTPVLCILQLSISLYLLESPNWLLSKDEQSIEARKIIKQFRGFRSDGDVECEVQHFLFALSKHQGSSSNTFVVIRDLLHDQTLRVLIISCIVLQMAQQLCGINAVFYYSSSIFEGVISNPLMGTNLVAFINVVATYVALKLMDTSSRRGLLLLSSGGMLLSTFLIIAALSGLTLKFVSLIAIMLFVSFFEIGLGPVTWLIVTEMFDSKYVATAMSLSCIINWICTFIVGLLFPFIQVWLGVWSFTPFAIVLAMTYLFIYFKLPETQGKTVEEIQDFISQGSQHQLYGAISTKSADRKLSGIQEESESNLGLAVAGANKRPKTSNEIRQIVYGVETYDIPDDEKL